ncbi:hypothetical protein EP47_03550 [Legionella norrlandica]|uniref:Glycosyltransferase 2-like domain-containing protein n=1 Tax=Legionella norrlandica TaxID=1498499 RepID=A0A0A2SX58_9GAMM|nr:glycosyltransferase family A protein [Legionella norrlandica]KGP64009.1 hypothetical protein EP47_03550 [Legionella norrlandica]
MFKKICRKRSQNISVIVISYNMQRELPRTIFSLLPPYQQLINYNLELEIIVIDNGSSLPLNLGALSDKIKVICMKNPQPSPVKAINYGLRIAKHNLVGVMIDGARLASPGLINKAIIASKIHHRPIIASYGFHLGPDVQMKSMHNGYNQKIEDNLLEQADWTNNGYNLFKISSFAGSSANGWFAPVSESNAIFMKKEMWEELDGYCEKFITPGGGLVNLDLYNRASLLPDSELIMVIGEGTFHQIHGGVATNRPTDSNIKKIFHDEYRQIRGVKFCPVNRQPIFIGAMPEELKESKLWFYSSVN